MPETQGAHVPDVDTLPTPDADLANKNKGNGKESTTVTDTLSPRLNEPSVNAGLLARPNELEATASASSTSTNSVISSQAPTDRIQPPSVGVTPIVNATLGVGECACPPKPDIPIATKTGHQAPHPAPIIGRSPDALTTKNKDKFPSGKPTGSGPKASGIKTMIHNTANLPSQIKAHFTKKPGNEVTQDSVPADIRVLVRNTALEIALAARRHADMSGDKHMFYDILKVAEDEFKSQAKEKDVRRK